MKPWIKPYCIEEMELGTTKRFIAFVLGGQKWYQICFEGSPILVNLTREQSYAICGALNGAYNLGRNEVE